MGGGRKKRGGFFFRWMRSDLPDREEPSAPVVLLSVKKTTAAVQKQQHSQPNNQRLISDDEAINERLTRAGDKNSNEDVKAPTIRLTQPQPNKPLLTQLNERFRKTLSLDSRASNRVNNSANPDNVRPKSMVVNNLQSCSARCNNTKQNNKKGCCCGIGHFPCPCVAQHPVVVSNCKEKVKSKSRFRPKSFFSLENFLDSRRSDESSADDFSSSKYRKFYLDSAESSPVFHGRTTPDLLDLPAISSCSSTPAKVESNQCKKRLDKLENHFNRVRDLRNSAVNSTLDTKRNLISDEEPLYSEPFYSSRSTLVVGGAVNNCYESLDSVPDISTHVKFQGFDDEELYVKTKTEERDRFLGNTTDHKKSTSNAVGTNFIQDFDNFNRRNYDWRKNIRDNSSTPSYEVHIKEDDVLINDRTRDLVVKTMDKSVDSIGSCSLDVDAENTDYSDTTSGSLNILTPSAASCQRDFTSRLQDRACRETLRVPQAHHFSGQNHPVSQPKKPSYLHLACSVNGYSNITTYDSKLRQKLNKSREASPGRPGNTVDMLRDCTDDAMAQRLNSSSSSTAVNQSGQTFFKTSYSETSISSQNILTFSKSNSNQNSEVHQTSKSFHLISNSASDASPSKSFIQQRVERLYGPGALAQGFFNQQRQKTKSQCEAEQAILNGEIRSPELVKAQNQQNSYSLFSHSALNNGKKNGTSPMNGASSFSNGNSPNCDSALPVLRHLRPEFRAQLPMLSPKRSLPFKIAETDLDSSSSNLDSSKNNVTSPRVKGIDVVDRALAKMDVNVDRSKFDTNATKEKYKSHITIVPMEICTSDNENVLRNGDASINIASVGESVPLASLISSDVTSDRLTTIGDQALKNLDNNCNQVSVPVKRTENKENVPLVNSRMPVECVDLTTDAEVQVQGQNGDVLKSLEAIKDEKGAGGAEEQDGHYFLELKRVETERLIRLAESAERDLEKIQDSAETNEEVLGFLRSAAGKARLLATQKMQQFEGLCHNNLNRRADEPFPTTCQDLQGFWDMVSLQVEDITQLFKQLETIREGGWKEVPSQKKTELQPLPQANPSSSQVSKTRRSAPARIQRQPEDVAKAKERDERRRNMMAEVRRKAAEKSAAGNDLDIQVFEPASKTNNLSS